MVKIVLSGMMLLVEMSLLHYALSMNVQSQKEGLSQQWIPQI
jgi:hypothetical protein